MIGATLRALIQLLSFTLLRITHRPELVGGLRIIYAAEADTRSVNLKKIADAMSTIESTDEHTAIWVRKHLSTVLVMEAGGPEYIGRIRSCLLSSGFLVASSPVRVALAIVHETAHSWLHAKGFRYRVSQRERLERICTRREAAFARKLPNGDQLADHIMARLEAPWWNPDEMRKRRSEEFRSLGHGEETAERLARWTDDR